MCEPGTFVFIRVPSFKGKERELHPFSVSSSPLQRHLRLSIRQVGDFTHQVSYLSLGQDNPDYWTSRRPGKYHATSTLRRAEIEVYGPFGGFIKARECAEGVALRLTEDGAPAPQIIVLAGVLWGKQTTF